MDPHPTSNGKIARGQPRPVRVNQPPLSVRAMRRTARVMEQLRAALGLQRTSTVAGVRYTETSSESLRRALSRRGSGTKEYLADFPTGQRLTLRCTPSRVYADLMEPRLLPCYEILLPYLRPGMRALDFGCSTGYGSAWLLDAVGPSGAVVAVDRDREGVEYAALRYASPNAAFEVGWTEALAGETDGAFDLVVSVDAFRESDDFNATIRELWRVLKPGGWMLIVTPAVLGPNTPRAPDAARAFDPKDLSTLVRAACEDQIRSNTEDGQTPVAVRWDESG
ncbi:MAG: methyltransferase domain-containing protein, partial [Phycisphaerales bacterium]|nr:methyltransferase domain-containing protein [Phycisphaerales bacterium]